MDMTVIDDSEYKKLKDQVLLSVGSSERYNQLLSTLKELFRDDINSPRRFERITTILHLLNILETRDVLSMYNVAPLKEIARRLPNSNELLEKINVYEFNRIPRECVNYYAQPSTNTTSNHPAAPAEKSYITNNPNTGMSAQKKQRIIEAVVEDIGVFWRDLARSLEIKERVIDDLNESRKSVPEKITYVMELYNKKADANTWFFDLCDALETCRRRDLVRKLKKITVMHI